MEKKPKNKILAYLFVVIVVGLFWRGMQLFGLIRCIPAKAIDQYVDCLSGEKDMNSIGELNLRCPFCHGHIKGIYYGIVDRHIHELDQNGQSLWEWGGCGFDGAIWVCQRCEKRFDQNGKIIRNCDNQED